MKTTEEIRQEVEQIKQKDKNIKLACENLLHDLLELDWIKPFVKECFVNNEKEKKFFIKPKDALGSHIGFDDWVIYPSEEKTNTYYADPVKGIDYFVDGTGAIHANLWFNNNCRKALANECLLVPKEIKTVLIEQTQKRKERLNEV